MRWMQRLKRVSHINIEYWGVCDGTLRIIACIETPELIKRILTHLAARNTESIDRPRAPPLHPPLTQPPACPSPALSRLGPRVHHSPLTPRLRDPSASIAFLTDVHD